MVLTIKQNKGQAIITRQTGTEVADNVYWFAADGVNWYIIANDDDELIIVDAGFPTHWHRLFSGLITLEYGVEDIAALILTHAHPDHIGFAERLRIEADVPVRLHEAGTQRAQAGGDPPVVATVKNLWRPAVLGYFVEVIRSKGTAVPPLTSVEPFTDGDELAVPGQPQVIHTPGHTEDEVIFYLPDRDIVFCGDALATVDFETWRGNLPHLMPEWINITTDQAQESLQKLKSLGDVLLLPGHGDPWQGEITEAIQSAKSDRNL